MDRVGPQRMVLDFALVRSPGGVGAAGPAVARDGGNLLLVDATAPPAPEDLAHLDESLPTLERVLLLRGPDAIAPVSEDAIRQRVRNPGQSEPRPPG